MSIKFKSVQRVNPQDPQVPGKFYAKLKNYGGINIREIRDDIADVTTVTSSDTFAVIDSFIRKFSKYLKKGHRISIGDLGTFRLSILSTATETADELNAGNIEKAKLMPTPGPILKDVFLVLKFQKE